MDNRTTSTNGRPGRMHLRADLVRLLGVLLLASFGTGRAQAQVAEGDLVYKFMVVGVHHHAEAKPVQYALLQQGFVHSCEFIEECACFKLASNVPLDYATLDALLHDALHALSGTVEVSDGTLLIHQPHPER